MSCKIIDGKELAKNLRGEISAVLGRSNTVRPSTLTGDGNTFEGAKRTVG